MNRFMQKGPLDIWKFHTLKSPFCMNRFKYVETRKDTLECQKYIKSGGSFIRRTFHEESILHDKNFEEYITPYPKLCRK